MPSEAYARANTLDLHVLDVSAKWANKQTQEASGQKATPKLSVQEMQAMIARARGEK